jgi:archaemetzincin
MFALLLSAWALAQTPLPPRVVAIIPMGAVDLAHLEAVAAVVQQRTDVQVRMDPQRQLPTAAYFARRKRWRAETILDSIELEPPAGAWKVIVVTAAEISTTKGAIQDWGIGGLGLIGGRSCVVSTFLLRKYSKSEETLRRRLADLTFHELGHTFGLEHCPKESCVMADAKGKLIQSLDRTFGRFCDACRRRVPRRVLRADAP